MIGIIKTGDLRFYYLSQKLKGSIYSNKLLDFYNVDILILPIGGVDAKLFIKDTDLNMIDFLGFNKLKKIIVNKAREELIDFANMNSIQVLSLENNFHYMYQNSILTAEGLHSEILNDLKDDSLNNQNTLILGYGYEGKALRYYFQNLTNLKIYARDSHDRKELQIFNLLEEDLLHLDKFNIIINTIPANVINKDNIHLLKPDGLYYEIASYPYGFDETLIKERKLHYKNLPKIPGRYKALASANLLKETIELLLKE